ncbi:MAG: trypsin-like peptidase domain-containing protein, partial [Dehalococcoidia bacterium]
MGHLASTPARWSPWGVPAVLLAVLIAGTALLASPRHALAAPRATEVFARVSPAVPVVETEHGHGTGFMLDASHVMTAAHVVEDFELVKVRFPGGATYGTSKVVARDRLLDLAVIEIPGTREVIPDFGEPPVVVGSELYVLGYPGNTERSPQPILSRGLVSQVLTWDTLGVTYLRTDASGAPGISGGPLLDEEGRIVGMIQFGSPVGGYMVAASASVLKERALRLLAGENVDGIARRPVNGPVGQFFDLEIAGDAAPEAAFTVSPVSETSANIEVSVADFSGSVSASLYSSRGDWLDGLVLLEGRTSGTLSATLEAGQRYWLSVAVEDPARVTVRSDVPLTRYADPDDARIGPGRAIGLIDYVSDTDCRPIALRAGQQVTVRAESIATDIGVYLVSPGGSIIGGDSDSADGVRGGDAEATRKVASDGDFSICVSSELPTANPAGYVLSVTTTPVPSVGSAAGTFAVLPATLGTAREANVTIALADGRAVVIDGLDAEGGYLATAEVFDPTTGAVSPIAARDVVARRDPSAVRLQDGRVLVVGGATAEGVTDAASVLDPAAGTWTSVGPMSIPRLGAEAILLEDGRVLIATGTDRFAPTVEAEIFDPATGRFSTTGAMTVARSGLFATRLQDGRVLFAGGLGPAQRLNETAEVYDPRTGRFTATGDLSTPRFNHNSTLLPSGKVLISGGSTPWEEVAEAELYDPATGRFTPTGAMSFARQAHAAVLLPNGRVLIAGGAYLDGVTRSLLVEVGAAELYDPATGTFLPAGALREPRAQFGALLGDGTVLFMGGFADGA